MARTGNRSKEMALVFGRHVRRLREARGWTQIRLSKEVHLHQTRISQIETAAGHRPTEQNAKDLDRVLGAEDLLVDLWPSVYEEVFPDWVQDFLELSRAAELIGEYAAGLVPGLLVTEAYARATLRFWASGDRLEEMVEARLARQACLTGEKPPHFCVILDEAVLVRPVGGREVMRGQLEHLLSMAELPHVEIQVLCFESGEHPGMSGSFTVLRLPDGTTAGYTEGTDVGRVFRESEDVERLMAGYDRLRALALPPAMSVDLIRSLLEDL